MSAVAVAGALLFGCASDARLLAQAPPASTAPSSAATAPAQTAPTQSAPAQTGPAQTGPAAPAPAAGAEATHPGTQPGHAGAASAQPVEAPAASEPHTAGGGTGTTAPMPAEGHGATAHDAPAAQDAHGSAQGTHAPAGEHAGGEEHAESPWALIARIFNFALLAGGLFYVARGPLSQYLASRTQQIRGDLVSARETSARATAQIADIERKLAALPAELEALRAQGAEEIAGEEARIRQLAERERQRLLDQTRREVDLQVRLARRELAAHAADLAVSLARERAARTIQDADQAHLADRYVSQVKNIHG